MAKKKRKKKLKIKIKKSSQGSFTAYCKRKGYSKVTTACISQGLKSSSSSIRKKANFARNARKWKR